MNGVSTESPVHTSTRSRTIAAHAKVNLVLHILAREASGFHGLETMFQRLALHDVVTVRIDATGSSVSCHGPAMPSGGLGNDEDNLAYRAAVAYARATQWDTGWHIDIEKHIPVGGGLGGGSADAAAVLRALNQLSPTPLSMEQLIAIGGTLGSDVPFCVRDVSRAWAWGRGDRLLVLPPLPSASVELYAFTSGVNTGEAYRAFAARAARDGGPRQPAPVLAHIIDRAVAYDASALADWSGVAALASNDFELVVGDLHDGVQQLLPQVRTRAAAIAQQAPFAIGMMSGSGATCIVVYQSSGEMLPAALSLPTDCTMLTTTTN